MKNNKNKISKHKDMRRNYCVCFYVKTFYGFYGNGGTVQFNWTNKFI